MLQGLIESKMFSANTPLLCGLRSFPDSQWWGGVASFQPLANPIYGSTSSRAVIFQEPVLLEEGASHIVSMSHKFFTVVEQQGLPTPRLFAKLPYFYVDKPGNQYQWDWADKRLRAEYENNFELLTQAVVHNWVQVNATTLRHIPAEELQQMRDLIRQYVQKGTRHVQKSQKAYFLFTQELMYPNRIGNGLALAVKEAEAIGMSGKLLLRLAKKFKDAHDD